MSTLARIRRVPVPENAEPLVDLARLAEVYRLAALRDQQAYDLRREGEELVREARNQGVPVARLTEVTKLTSQRIYQVLRGPTVKPVEDSNGNGSTD